MGVECSRHGTDEKCYTVSIGKPEGKRLLESCRRRWEDNIRRDLQ
jgi:hypothetical protein